MGELIRFVSSHEVGHTLGLHNMGASSATPVENETRSIKKKRTYFFYHGLCTFQLCCAARRWGDFSNWRL
jgi:hypothetical protein